MADLAPTIPPAHRPASTRTVGRLAMATVVLAVAAGAAACGSSSSSGAQDDQEVQITDEAPTVDATDPSATETTATPKPTVTTEAPGATTAPIATTGMAQPSEAALRLYDAWFADDRITAATVAEPDAVEAMWQTARGDYSLYSGCDSGEFSTSGCLFRGNNGTIQMTMERRGDLWIVIEAFYSEP